MTSAKSIAALLFLSWGTTSLAQSFQFEFEFGALGDSSGELSSPHNVAVDSSGNIFIADFDNNRIQRFDNQRQALPAWGSAGSANGQFDGPIGVAVDSADNVYVVERSGERVQKFDSSGIFLLSFGISGTGVGQFLGPSDIAVAPDDTIYVADRLNHRIQKFDSSGNFFLSFGSQGSSVGQFEFPTGLAVSSTGNVYVADQGNNRIQRFTSDGTLLTAFGSSGSGPGELDSPSDVAVDSDGDLVVVDKNNTRLQVFGFDGEYFSQFGSPGSAAWQFSQPRGAAFDASDVLYIADRDNHRIQGYIKKGPSLGLSRSGSAINFGAIDDLGDQLDNTIVLTYSVFNPSAQLDPDSVAFTLGSPTVDAMTNATNFQVLQAPESPLAPESTTQFEIQFEVPSGGPFNLDVSLPNDDPIDGPFQFQIRGNNIGTQDIDIQRPAGAENSIPLGGTDAVGDQAVGTVSFTYTVENSGVLELMVDSPSASNLSNVSNFTVLAAPVSPVAVGGTTTFDIQFDIDAPGAFSLDLSVANDDSDENPYNFTITGNGIGPDIDIQRPAGSDNSIPDGGTNNVGDRAIDRTSLIYTVENLGNAELSIDAAPMATNLVNVNTFIVELGPSSPLAPGQTTTFQVSFEVETNGPFSFDLSVGNSDPDENPYNIQVTGDGVGGDPEIQVTRDSMPIDHGTTDSIGLFPALGQSLTYTVQNSGNVPLSIGLPVLQNGMNVTDLEVTVAPSDSVAVAGQTTFEIAFTPVSVGDFSFDLSIDNNDADENPYNFQVAGKVPDAALSSELAKPLLLVDNDGDGIPNPSDTIRFGVLLRNDGEIAAGQTDFFFTAPAATTITRSNRTGSLDGTPVMDDGTSISVSFFDIPGGGAEFPGAITFDLVIDNDIAVDEIQLQASFDYGGEISLTDDPSTTEQGDPTKVEIGSLSRLLPPETSRNFGESTALSDDFVVVGSPGDDGGVGAVSIYRILSDGRREFVDRITPPSITTGAASDFDGDAFGLDVSLDGDVLVVGSTDSGVAPKGSTGNKIAVYQLVAGQRPELLAQISANLNSGFGTAVDIDNGAVVVGAPEEDDGVMEDTGAVYMYTLSNLLGGDDTPQRRIVPDNPESQGRFGAAVACAGGKIVVGSPGPIGQALAGRAAIIDAFTGMSVADIAAPFDGSGEFGAAVAIEGDRVMIGAPGANNRSGGAFEYNLEGSAMGGRIISNDAASGDEFGKALSLENGELFVGAPNSEVQGLIDVGNFGAIYRFSAQRLQMQKIGAFSESSNQFEQQEGFGTALAVNGTTMIIGAPKSQDLRGAAAFQRGGPKASLFADGFECRRLLGCDSQ